MRYHKGIYMMKVIFMNQLFSKKRTVTPRHRKTGQQRNREPAEPGYLGLVAAGLRYTGISERLKENRAVCRCGGLPESLRIADHFLMSHLFGKQEQSGTRLKR